MATERDVTHQFAIDVEESLSSQAPFAVPHVKWIQTAAHQEWLWAILMLAPNLILVAVFLFVPAVAGLSLSFTHWDLLTPAEFAGLDNYRVLLDDKNFWTALRNTAVYTFVSVPILVASGLILALLLHSKLPGTMLFRALFFIPVIMSGVVVSLAWRWLLHPDYGVVNYGLESVGIRGPNWFADPSWAMPAIIVVSVWQGFGFNMVIFLAALGEVPQSLYEAARIDGANRWQEFRNVTLPMISAITYFVIILSVIGSFQVFDLVFVLTGGGPGRSTSVMVQYIYESAFRDFQMGYASALSVVLFLIILAMSLLQWQLRNRWTYAEED